MTDIDERRARRVRTKLAYQRVLLGDGGLPGPEARFMLHSLKRFCRIEKPGIVVSIAENGATRADPIASAYQAGLQDALRHIALMAGIDLQLIEDPHERPSTVEQ